MYSIHSIDPEVEKMTIRLMNNFIENIDTLWISLSNYIYTWWYKKEKSPTVEMVYRTELKVISEVLDCYSDVDIKDATYVDINNINQQLIDSPVSPVNQQSVNTVL